MHTYSQEISQKGTIPWNDRYMDIGKGYDINTLQVLPSPFERSSATLPKSPIDPSSRIQVAREVMRSETDLHSFRTASASVSASGIFAFLFSSKSSVESLKTAKCNATNMIVITKFTITLAPEKIHEDALELRLDARNHLTRSPQEFFDIYGQYLITGTERQSTFISISKYRSAKRESLDRLQAKIGVGFQYKLVDIGSAVDIAKETNSTDSSITQSHDVSLSGYTSGDSGPLTFATMDVDRMLTHFLEQLSPIPHIAVLTHYSTLLPGSLPRPVATRLLDEAAKLLRDCVMLQLRYQSNVLVQAQREATKLEGITERLYANLMLSSNTSKNDINTARESIEAMMQECNIWQERAARRSQIDDEAKKKLDSQWHKCCKMKPGHPDIRPFGMNAHSRCSFPEAEISQYSEVWEVVSARNGMPVCQYGEVELKVPGRVVVAAEVKSHWDDGTNGWWKKKEGAGGIGKDSFGVQFSTEHYRGGHWSATVWSVDGELYQREEAVK